MCIRDSNRVRECPKIHFERFLMILGWPVGTTLGSLFHNFIDLRHQKACFNCRHAFSRFLIKHLIDFWCVNLSKTQQIQWFSLDFIFLIFYWFEWLQAPVWPSFGSFWKVLGHQFGDLLGYCAGIEISTNFRVSPEPPQAERRRQVDGKSLVQGVQ